MRVLGVDGCPGGWAVVSVSADGPPKPDAWFAPHLRELPERVVAIDIPIGLPERIVGPGRVAEQAIRGLLGPRRASVFSIASRSAVYAGTWEDACAAALATSDPPRKPSRQAFELFPMIRELDALITPANQARTFETHAELAFWQLAGERPMALSKTARGLPLKERLAERIGVLQDHGIDFEALMARRPKLVPLIDLCDAAGLALIARRCAAGLAQPFPDPPGRDARGLRIAIWA